MIGTLKAFCGSPATHIQSLPAAASPWPFPQGCYTVILNAFETYVYLAGALAIGVLAIEVSAAAQVGALHGAWSGPHNLYPQLALPAVSLP